MNDSFHTTNASVYALIIYAAIVTYKTKTTKTQHPTLAHCLGMGKCSKPCFLVEIYSLTIQLQILGLEINT